MTKVVALMRRAVNEVVGECMTRSVEIFPRISVGWECVQVQKLERTGEVTIIASNAHKTDQNRKDRSIQQLKIECGHSALREFRAPASYYEVQRGFNGKTRRG